MSENKKGMISPLMAMLLVSMVIMGSLGITSLVQYIDLNAQEKDDNGIINPEEQGVITYDELNRFETLGDIKAFLDMKNNYSSRGYSNGYYYNNFPSGNVPRMMMMTGTADSAAPVASASFDGGSGEGDHSTTNVQVQGVDEGDIVKNDGEFAYIVSGDKDDVIIVNLFPPAQAEIVNRLVFEGQITDIYLNDGKLVLLGNPMIYSQYYSEYDYGYYSSYSDRSKCTVKVYDLEDRYDPTLTREVQLNGSYQTSRIIGDYFYLIANQGIRTPMNESTFPVPASEIYYIDEYDHSYRLTTFMSINVQDNEEEPEVKVILMGSSNEIYVSLDNIYISYRKTLSYVERREIEIEYVDSKVLPQGLKNKIMITMDSNLTRWEKVNVIDKLINSYTKNLTFIGRNLYYNERNKVDWELQREIGYEVEKTTIHKISINNGSIRYVVSGCVPGHVLNRFSMDENDGYFRMATTIGHVSRSGGSTSENRVYVLNGSLSIVGRVVNIAPGERIYSARFMGDRGYLVTFKKVDPFFVVDLSEPSDPRILGELKIPGYSNYLHPYDENHVIGIGKHTVEAEGGNFAWYQGVKLSLFDVSDVRNPKELSKYIIGDRGTESLALNDPHAFTFSREKNLLVIPIYLVELTTTQEYDRANARGEHTWTGAYVFDISAEDGIELNGRITHTEDDGQIPDNYYYSSSSDRIKRSFYIEDVLYTVSDDMVKANMLDDLEEITKIDLGE